MKTPIPLLIFWMEVLVLLTTNLKQIANLPTAISFSSLILLTHFTTKGIAYQNTLFISINFPKAS